MSSSQIWPIIVGLVLAVSVPVGKWLAGAIADRVNDQIGDALQERWEKSIDDKVPGMIEAAIAPVLGELTTNGGESVKDRVNDMWLRFGNVERSLNDN